MKKVGISLFAVIGLTIIYLLVVHNTSRNDLVVYASHGLLRELTIDEKIEEAQLIIIGKVKTELPSKWKLQHQKEAKDALPQDVLREGGLFTDYLINIDQVLKGGFEDKVIRVRSFTGETDLVRWEGDSEPSFEIGQIYLLFLVEDYGPTTIVDTGDYISVNANTAVYRIDNGQAISADDQWVLEDLIAYINNKLAGN